MDQKKIGIVGLGVMGRNLALNFAEKGFFVVAYDPWENARDSLTEQLSKEPPELSGRIFQASSEAELIENLEPPRNILLMVKAGGPVDDQINSLVPQLDKGDCLIDGGNSLYKDTIQREAFLQSKGLNYLGLGISGGEEGARNGPSMMAGGNAAAYAICQPMLEAVSAKYEGEPCCSLVGSDGAGHFVKMVHNGIEYAIMQIIAEAYLLMRDVYHLDAKWSGRIFSDWNETELRSYLIEISSKVLARTDDLADGALVDVILDKAGQKGTGKWSSEAAFDFGVPANAIAESVFARAMASIKEEREAASSILTGPTCNSAITAGSSMETLRQATLCAVIVAYAQGLALISAAAKEMNWDTDLSVVAEIWRNGCVIRADMLDDISKEYRNDPSLANLMCSKSFSKLLEKNQKSWRSTIKLAIDQGAPVPVLSSSLSYFDGYRTARSSANLLQAQRDFFGAHTYERTDREGTFHTIW